MIFIGSYSFKKLRWIHTYRHRKLLSYTTLLKLRIYEHDLIFITFHMSGNNLNWFPKNGFSEMIKERFKAFLSLYFVYSVFFSHTENLSIRKLNTFIWKKLVAKETCHSLLLPALYKSHCWNEDWKQLIESIT